MNPEWKQKWLTALRSSEYKQTTGTLRNTKNEFCCLGVLCDTKVSSWQFIDRSKDYYNWNGTEESSYLLPEFKDELGITDLEESKLIEMNDDGHSDFRVIAAYIEENM